jgi:hypothetical protein
MYTEQDGYGGVPGGVLTVSVGIAIILLCVTNITSNVHLNNAT